jgi:hypothetical protein
MFRIFWWQWKREVHLFSEGQLQNFNLLQREKRRKKRLMLKTTVWCVSL